jgi:heterodisulfide reductase subunit C
MPQITHQADLDPEFGRRVAHRVGGELLAQCIQCGTCSATCPVSGFMDYTPRKIIAMTRAGFRQQVLSSNTIWLCASCYACTVDCPKQIRITDVMYALKREAIESGSHPKRFAIPVLAREFCSIVRSAGRNNEAQLIVRSFLKTNPWKLIINAPLALRLMWRRRLPIFERRAPQVGGSVRALLGNVSYFRQAAAAGQTARH